MTYFARTQIALLSACIALLATLMRGTDRALCSLTYLSNAILCTANRMHRALLAYTSMAYIYALSARNSLRNHVAMPDPESPTGNLGDEFVGLVLVLCAALTAVLLISENPTDAATLIAWAGK